MAVAARRDTRMTVAEFRLWAEPRPDEERWELIDGIALLMSPSTARHQRIVSNLIRRLDELAERRAATRFPASACSARRWTISRRSPTSS